MKLVLSLILLLFLFTGFAYGQSLELVQNGGFESGADFIAPPWELDGFDRTTFDDESPIVIANPLFARSGLRGLVFGTENTIEQARQKIILPSNAKKITLSFWLRISSREPNDNVEDIFVVELLGLDKRTTVADLEVYANTDEKKFNKFKKVKFNLTKFKGQEVFLEFSSGNDLTFSTLFILDDVSIQVK